VNDRFLRACWREPVDCTPVWFMRQAGRSSPAYRAIRAKHGILEIAKSSELATEVTLQPLRELGVDAAIVFADLLLPIEAMGLRVRIDAGEGPVIEPPLRSPDDVGRLKRLDPGRDLSFVLETIRRVRAHAAVPCIGFAGAPFTMASYMIEGGASREFAATKLFMHGHPAEWRALMDLLVEGIAAYLRAQVDAGAQALQVFDSWVGALSPRDYETGVLPFTRRLFREIREAGVPSIHFGTGTAGFLESFAAAGGDVVGVDWRIPIDVAWQRVGGDRGIQGNLDPAALLGPREAWRLAAEDVLHRAGDRPGHVFNLGHGVLPETRQDELRALVELVHDSTRRG
jgi:uroporphyrinogen decarboxylase